MSHLVCVSSPSRLIALRPGAGYAPAASRNPSGREQEALATDRRRALGLPGQRDDAIIEPALEQGTVYLPPVVAAELLSGRMAERARGELEEFLLTLPPCQADVAHWFGVGRLRNSLAAKGLSLSTPDAHVAQCALDLGADLLSADAVFRLVARHTKLSLSTL